MWFPKHREKTGWRSTTTESHPQAEFLDRAYFAGPISTARMALLFGSCKAPTHYPCSEHRHDPLSSPSACRSDGDHGAEVFSSRTAANTGGASQWIQILIPEWMLDQDLCGGMEIVESPALSIAALLSLRDLGDAQPRAPEPSGGIASELSSPGGASDEPAPPGSSFLGDSPVKPKPLTMPSDLAILPIG